jgi:hypothetical protein
LENYSDTILFIGTSPINLLKAYLLLKKNPTLPIHFIDTNANIGGAWFSDITEKNNRIESGCHIWSYCPEVYHYLKNEFDVELMNFSPPAVFVKGKIRLPYSTKSIFDSYKYILINCFSNWEKLKKIKNTPAYYFKIFNKKNQYPSKGSPELIQSLLHKLNGYPNVKFTLNTKVNYINCTDSKIEVNTDNVVYHCEDLFLTSVTDFSFLQKDNLKIEIKSKRIDYIHVLLEFDKKPLRKVSYERLMNDNIIHRITDISYQTENQEFLILIGIKEQMYYQLNEKELFDYLRNYLITNKICNSSFQIKKVKDYIFPTHYIDLNQREEIKRLNKNIHLTHSTDLMYGFFYILKEEGLI